MSAIVLLIGAGATVSDVSTAPLRLRPPLDRGFFAISRRFEPALTNTVADYMSRTYEADITHEAEDYLERVMAAIYTDVHNPALEKEATAAFRALLRLFTARLARTTNGISATTKRYLYRIVTAHLARGFRPEDITVVTFNQDLQVEKMLEHITKAARWAHIADEVWRFPHCYRLGEPEIRVTRPTATLPSFGHADSDGKCIEVLKMHGSLNWYSTHNSSQPTPKAMFNQSRKLSITARVNIPQTMTLTKQKKLYLLPVIVPPVSHKSAVLHDRLHQIWDLAERRLTDADEIYRLRLLLPSTRLRELEPAKTIAARRNAGPARLHHRPEP